MKSNTIKQALLFYSPVTFGGAFKCAQNSEPAPILTVAAPKHLTVAFRTSQGHFMDTS
jgi:hypothetical protein